MFFARWIEHALDVSVQRPHDANAREPRRAAEFDHEDQRFDWAHERAVDDQASLMGLLGMPAYGHAHIFRVSVSQCF